MMKTILLLALSSMIIAGVLPSLPAKIILSAFCLTGGPDPRGLPRTHRLPGRGRFSFAYEVSLKRRRARLNPPRYAVSPGIRGRSRNRKNI